MKRIIVSSLLFYAFTGYAYAKPETPAKAAPQYDLSVRITPDAHHLEVTGTLFLPPVSEARSSIQMGLSNVMRDLRVEVVEPKSRAGQAKVEKQRETNKMIVWIATPASAIPPGEPVKLRFSYQGGEEIRFVFYIGPQGSFAGGFNTAWYPQVEGERKNQVAKSKGRMAFSVPVEYKVIATGKRLSTAEQEGKGDFLFDVVQPSMFSFAAAKYIVEQRVSNSGIHTAAYVLRARTHIKDYLDKCAQVMDVLVREFGPNPYGDFALVEVPNEQSDKADFAGASFEGFIMSNSSFLDQDFNTAYYGHEISHQWWGVSVGRNDGLGGRMMLDEAMAQYGSLRAVEIIEGPRAAEQYRRMGYPGYVAMQNATGYFMVESAGFDQPLSSVSPGQYARILADGKGFIVYDMLSRTIGRETFSRTLQSIAREHAGSGIGWDEFLQAIEKGAGKDLKWFYEQWFERKGAPEWNVSWKQEGDTVRGVVTQAQPYYRATLEVLIEGDEYQTSLQTIELRGERTEFSFPVRFRARSVTVDPHFLVLNRTPQFRALKSAFGACLRARGERDRKLYDEAEKTLRAALEKESDPDIYGVRFTIEVALGQLFAEQKKFAEAKTYLQNALARAARRGDLLPSAYLSLAKVAKELNDEATLRYAVSGAISAEAALGGGTGAASEARSLLSK
jgi:tetratricopeptide (TPR) repeat protein